MSGAHPRDSFHSYRKLPNQIKAVAISAIPKHAIACKPVNLLGACRPSQMSKTSGSLKASLRKQMVIPVKELESK